MRAIVFSLALLCISMQLYAETPASLLAGYAQQASQDNPAYVSPSALIGQQFFQSKHGRDWSCASCHTNMPTQSGKHQTTGKSISPLAPAANPDRFISMRKVEKWFRRNCGDVAGRECTAAEKADVIAYLINLQ